MGRDADEDDDDDVDDDAAARGMHMNAVAEAIECREQSAGGESIGRLPGMMDMHTTKCREASKTAQEKD